MHVQSEHWGWDVHKSAEGSKCSLDRLRSWLALVLVVNCLVTFMALINKICEQISLIDVVKEVAVWHVTIEVVIQVHNQSNTEGFWILFWFIFSIMLQLFQSTMRFFGLEVLL